MARVPYLTRSELPTDQQAIYDRIGKARGGRVAKVFQLFLNAPELAGRIGDLGAYARFETRLPADTREIAILTTARELNCQYEFTHHVPYAQKAGVRDEVIEGIKNRTTKGMIPQESVFVDYAKQVLGGKVNDATFEGVEHLVRRGGAVELTMVISYYGMIGHVMNALGIELEEGEKPLMPEG